MTKEQIKNHKAWEYINTLTPAQRFTTLLGSMRPQLEKEFQVKIEQWPYTRFGEVKDDMIAISVKDAYMGDTTLAVLIPT